MNSLMKTLKKEEIISDTDKEDICPFLEECKISKMSLCEDGNYERCEEYQDLNSSYGESKWREK